MSDATEGRQPVSKLAIHPCRYQKADETWADGFAVASAPGLCDVLYIIDGDSGRVVEDGLDYRFTSRYGVQAGGMYLLEEDPK
jgi:hypothetical protein